MPIGSAVRYLKRGEWEKAHRIVQEDESTLGCWAHGIVHVLEGDIPNARYWYRRAHRPFPAAFDADLEVTALATAIKEQSS
jgi:hypothetical protein